MEAPAYLSTGGPAREWAQRIADRTEYYRGQLDAERNLYAPASAHQAVAGYDQGHRDAMAADAAADAALKSVQAAKRASFHALLAAAGGELQAEYDAATEGDMEDAEEGYFIDGGLLVARIELYTQRALDGTAGQPHVIAAYRAAELADSLAWIAWRKAQERHEARKAAR